jgi:hypothetical protein
MVYCFNMFIVPLMSAMFHIVQDIWLQMATNEHQI